MSCEINCETIHETMIIPLLRVSMRHSGIRSHSFSFQYDWVGVQLTPSDSNGHSGSRTHSFGWQYYPILSYTINYHFKVHFTNHFSQNTMRCWNETLKQKTKKKLMWNECKICMKWMVKWSVKRYMKQWNKKKIQNKWEINVKWMWNELWNELWNDTWNNERKKKHEINEK